MLSTPYKCRTFGRRFTSWGTSRRGARTFSTVSVTCATSPTSFVGPAFREIKDLFGCFRAGMINRRGSQACGRSCVIKDKEACAQ